MIDVNDNKFLSNDAKEQTVKEARSLVRSMLQLGVECPCCGQYAKLYKRKITSTMAKCLLIIYRFFKANPHSAQLHVPSYLVKVKNDSSIAGGDVAKLRHWGLLEPIMCERNDGSKRAGYYKITPLAVDWIEGRVTIPRFAYIFNQRLFKMSDSKVGVQEALGDRFNYQELMRA